MRIELDFTGFRAAHEAQTALAFVHFAGAGTDVALDTPVLEDVPVSGGMGHGVSWTRMAD